MSGKWENVRDFCLSKINLGENIFFILIDHASSTVITWMTPFVLFLLEAYICFKVAGEVGNDFFCSFMSTRVTHEELFKIYFPWCRNSKWALVPENRIKAPLVSMKYKRLNLTTEWRDKRAFTTRYLWGIFDLIPDIVLVAFIFKCRWHVLCISTF